MMHTARPATVTDPFISTNEDRDTGVVNETDGHIALMANGVKVWESGTSAAGKVMRGSFRQKVALSAAADTAGAILAWLNPTGGSIIVTRVILDLTTAATGSCTVDVGVAADGTTLNDTIMDGLNVNSAAGTFDNIENQGTNGKSALKMTSTQYLTASTASGAIAGAVGFFYIEYFVI